MPINLKALIVVLVLAAIVFKLAKQTALLFIAEKDFQRRRNVWFVLTVIAFLSPNIWLYAVIAIPFLVLGGRRDSNPSAFYLFLLFTVPPVFATIPLPGNAKLIDLSNPLLVIVCVLVPAAIAIRRADRGSRIQGSHTAEWWLFAYGVLTSIFYIHVIAPDGTFYQSSVSDFVRRLITFLIGVFVPYYVISRSAQNRRIILDNIASFVLPCLVMAVIGMFESARGWLLYESIPVNWGLADSFTSYFVRGTSLRAMASTPHSLSLGYDLAIAFGLWLSLQSYVKSRRTRYGVTAMLCLGLIVTYSRGPWACMALIYVMFVGLRPGARSALMKSVLTSAAVLAAISLSPFGEKMESLIPFVGGKVGDASIDYRKQLFARGWTIFQEHPILGDQYALAKMQDLRQGQGIVDLVNGYVSEGLARGALGLTLFVSLILWALFKVLAARKTVSLVDRRFASVGLSLACGIVGTLFVGLWWSRRRSSLGAGGHGRRVLPPEPGRADPGS